MHQLDVSMTRTLNMQAKLAIGEPDDKYEQEADAIAAQVEEQINAPSAQQPSLQREELREEEELQMKPILQRREAVEGAASPDLESAINRARGGGQALDAGLQRSIGEAMGADFSEVRVHTDAQPDQLNQSIQAKAFTTGQDVFFRRGEYNPGSRGEQGLIAHELTHVVQQNGGRCSDIRWVISKRLKTKRKKPNEASGEKKDGTQ